MLYSFTSLFSFDITPYAKEVTYNKGDTIYALGDEIKTLVYIYEGLSSCSYIYPDGVPSLLDEVSSPAFYGELELLTSHKSTSLVTAITECRAYVIDIRLIEDKLLSDSVFLKAIASYLGEKLYRVNKKTSSNLSFPLRSRLSAYILKKEKNNVYSENHINTARILSVSYRHLMYELRKLEDGKVIERSGRGRYVIIDKGALAKEAKNAGFLD